MSKTGLVETDCGIASYSVDKPNPPECWPADFGAPRGQKEVDEEGGGGTSVEAALESFCNDIDGQKVEDNTDEEKTTHAKRWGYAEWRVSNRRSFWLKAQYASRPGCQGYEFPHKTNCKAALRQGLDACSANQGRTTGFSIQGIGCIDYSIHISDSTRDDSPPWKETVKEFPPPLSAQKIGGGAHEVNCTWYTTPGKPLQDQDFNNALDAFCKDGADIKGWGRDHWDDMTDYPPEGQPQFWAGKQLGMHLTMGAKTVNNDGNDEPYEDISWCQ
jgi:hypothetical protein